MKAHHYHLSLSRCFTQCRLPESAAASVDLYE